MFLLSDKIAGQLIKTVGSNGQSVYIEYTYDEPFILIQNILDAYFKTLYVEPRPQAWGYRSKDDHSSLSFLYKPLLLKYPRQFPFAIFRSRIRIYTCEETEFRNLDCYYRF